MWLHEGGKGERWHALMAAEHALDLVVVVVGRLVNMILPPVDATGQGKRVDETVSRSKKMVNSSCEARKTNGMAAQV